MLPMKEYDENAPEVGLPMTSGMTLAQLFPTLPTARPLYLWAAQGAICSAAMDAIEGREDWISKRFGELIINSFSGYARLLEKHAERPEPFAPEVLFLAPSMRTDCVFLQVLMETWGGLSQLSVEQGRLELQNMYLYTLELIYRARKERR